MSVDIVFDYAACTGTGSSSAANAIKPDGVPGDHPRVQTFTPAQLYKWRFPANSPGGRNTVDMAFSKNAIRIYYNGTLYATAAGSYITGKPAFWSATCASFRRPAGRERTRAVMAIEMFVRRAMARCPRRSVPLVACFYAVRELPYALDGAHDAAGLFAQGRGDCLAKSELMMLAAQELDIPARYVRWPYLLPDVVPEVAELPSRLDVHRAIQVRMDETWVLAGATNHAGLWRTPLLVSDWDGHGDTAPGFPLAGPVIVEEEAPDQVRRAQERVRLWCASCLDFGICAGLMAFPPDQMLGGPDRQPAGPGNSMRCGGTAGYHDRHVHVLPELARRWLTRGIARIQQWRAGYFFVNGDLGTRYACLSHH